MRHDRFEWDDDKARSNLAKHKVSFERAIAVFDDDRAVIEPDDDVSEERWQTIGFDAARVLVVIWTERRNNVIRIISARKANRHEENRYDRQARS